MIGTRPDGWWRDREGATRRLLGALDAFAGGPDEVIAVLDAGPPELAGRRGGIAVVLPPHGGRDAADREIVRLLAADPEPTAVTVVTSDRALARRARALGADVQGAGAFRRRLDGAP